jgi:hypothetical protein
MANQFNDPYGVWNESGNALINGKPGTYDVRPDGRIDLFPGGLPRGPHEQMPH